MLDVEICSVASLLVGGNDFGSFEEDSREAKLCSALYQETRDTLLQQNLWRFSLKQEQLSRLTSIPLFDYQYAYQIPADALRIQKAERGQDFRVYGDKIFTNADEFNITYQYRVDEVTFPAYFIRVLQLQIASLLAIALTEDKQKYAIWEEKSIKEMAKAKAIDSQNETNLKLNGKNFWITVVR